MQIAEPAVLALLTKTEAKAALSSFSLCRDFLSEIAFKKSLPCSDIWDFVL